MGWLSLQATLLFSSFPYTLFVDANTNGASGLCLRVASSRFNVPPALMSKSVTGSSRDVVTATWPARCRIASWFLTCSLRALAFLTSSLTKVVSVGYWVMSHFRLRSVPGRLRLSSTVTCHPASTIRVAALTPRKPAPPVMSIRRDGPGSPLRAARGLDRVLSPDSARSEVGVIEGPYLKTIVGPRPPTRRARPPIRRCQIRPSVSPATHPYHRRVTPPDRILSEPDTR